MPQSTYVNLTLDRLGPTYVAGKVHLALTHSVALAAEAPIEAPELLRPWAWKADDGSNTPPNKAQLFTKGATGEWEKLGGPIDMADPPSHNAALQQELDERFETLKAQPALFVLDPRNPPEQTDQDLGTRWPHLLEAALRLPVPLGAQLRLARLIEADPAALAHEEIVAAPLFMADGVSWVPDKVEEVGDLRKVTYGGVGTVGTLEAWTPGYKSKRDEAAREQQGRTESHLDLGKLWVQLPEKFGGRAWLGELPYEAADVADLARHLLDAIEDTRVWLATQQENSAPPRGLVPAGFAKRVRGATLAALRLAAHAGAAPGDPAPGDPDEPVKDPLNAPALPRSALELLGRLGMAGAWTTIRDYEKGHDPGSPPDAGKLDIWRDLLAGLGEPLGAAVARLEAAVPAADGAVPLATLVEVVRALAGQARDDGLGPKVLAAHWVRAKVQPAPDKLAAALQGLQLRRRLILDRLDDPWLRMTRTDTSIATSVGDEAAVMRGAFAAAVWSFAAPRLGLPEEPQQPPPGTPFDSDEYLTWWLATKLRERLKVATQALGPETAGAGPNPDLGPEGRTAGAQPLSLVAGQLRTPEAHPEQGNDFSPSARLAGIGVLLRQRNRNGGTPEYGPWRPLTMARPELEGTATVLAGHALAPVPIVEVAGLESWAITYANHPLTAESLGEKLADQVGLAGPPGQAAPPLELRVRLRQVPNDGAAPPWACELPMLKYGQSYEIACFGVTISGALPRELCKAGEPSTLADPSSAEPPEPDRFVRRLRHLRRTRVAAPRLVGSGGTRFALPELPRKDVYPRAADIVRDTTDADPVGQANAELGSLALLVPPGSAVWVRGQASAFTFGVRPPAVELADWHCWRAMDLFETGSPQDDPLVRAAWQEVRQQALKPDPDGKLPPDSREGRDLSLDDLAVTRLGFRLREVQVDGTLGPGDWWVPPALGFASNPTGLDLLQAVAGEVRVEAVASSEPASLGEAWPLLVKVPSGKVCRLLVASLVPEGRYPAGGDEGRRRFRSNPDRIEPVVQGSDRWLVAATAPLTIEVAAPDLPDADALRQAIRVLGQRGDELAVGIDPTVAVAFDHVKEVTLERQMWGWRGRRLVEAFPAKDLVPEDVVFGIEGQASSPAAVAAWAKLPGWDGAGFGDRSDEDHLSQEGVLPGPARPGPGNDPLATGAVLHRINLPNDRRAQYWRYRAEARSRYAGLMADADRHGKSRSLDWKRLVILDRLVEPMPRPRLRFLLPLTQSSSGDTSGSGWAAPLLGLFDETWSATAGPGELLEAEIVRTASKRQEFGPDPIDSATGPVGEVVAETVGQPSGLTFDVDAEAGLPVTTAWEIRVTGAAVRPWAFAKLRFRRKVDRHLDHQRDERVSAWTDPVWAQLLPDFTFWRVRATGVAGPVPAGALRLTDDGRLQVKLDHQAAPVDAVVLPDLPDQRDPASLRRRRVYVLVTRRVREAASPQRSEVPLCLGAVGATPMPAYAPDGKLDGANRRARRARLLEVEYRDGKKVEDADPKARLVDHPLFPALFPEDGETDATARVVRVSPPLWEEE